MRGGSKVLVPVIVVGLVAAFMAIAAREGDASFVFRQLHPREIEAGQLARAVMGPIEPVPSGQGTAALSAKCSRGNEGPRHNPWLCRVQYGSGRRVGYYIFVEANGSWNGTNRRGDRFVKGCCLPIGRE